MVLTSFIEGLHDANIRRELRKSKPANPDAALALALELHAFMEKYPSFRSGYQARVDIVSATPPQPWMATASSSHEDLMGTLIQTIRQDIQKASPQTCQNSSSSRSSSTDGRSLRFNSPGPNRQSVNTNLIQQNYRNSNNSNNRYNNIDQNKRYNSSGNQQNNRYNSNRITPNQQQNRNNISQQICRHCNRTDHQSRDCRACFNCGRLGHMSRKCRAPQQNQNNRQKTSNINQNSRNYDQDRNANTSQQQIL